MTDKKVLIAIIVIGLIAWQTGIIDQLFILTGEEGFILTDDFSSGSLGNFKIEQPTSGSPYQIGVINLAGGVGVKGYSVLTAPNQWGNNPAPGIVMRAGTATDPDGNKRGGFRIIYDKDIKGGEYRLNLLAASTSGTKVHPSIQVFNDLDSVTCGISTDDSNGLSPGQRGSLEIRFGELNPDEIIVRYNGQTLCNTVMTGKVKVAVGFGPASRTTANTDLIVYSSRIKPNILPTCALGSNDLVAFESFQAGQNIDFYSTRFPTKSYCINNEAIITDVTAGGTFSSSEVYYILQAGGTYSVPQGQTVGLFYIFDNSQGLVPTQCDVATEVYNIDRSACLPATGVVTVCSVGIFDKDQGLCVVESVPTCAQGRLEQDASGEFICVYNPPVNQVCQTGTLQADGTCTSLVESTPVCTQGTLVQDSTSKEFSCLYNPPVNNVCQTGTLQPDGTCQAPAPSTPTSPCPTGFTKEVLPSGAVKCTSSLQASQVQIQSTPGVTPTPSRRGVSFSTSAPTTTTSTPVVSPQAPVPSGLFAGLPFGNILTFAIIGLLGVVIYLQLRGRGRRRR